MRFSIVFILFALFALILAVPVPSGRGKGGSSGNPGKKSNLPPAKVVVAPKPIVAKPKVAAHPGDLVSVEPQHFTGGAVIAQTADKPRPAIVLHHHPQTHDVTVVPVGHTHPPGVPSISSHAIGIQGPETRISMEAPKVIHQDNINKALGPPPPGRGLPQKLNQDQFTKLHHELSEFAA